MWMTCFHAGNSPTEPGYWSCVRYTRGKQTHKCELVEEDECLVEATKGNMDNYFLPLATNRALWRNCMDINPAFMFEPYTITTKDGKNITLSHACSGAVEWNAFWEAQKKRLDANKVSLTKGEAKRKRLLEANPAATEEAIAAAIEEDE
jgi:t-SNARE complex subunit (syntaxin)